MAEPLDKSLIAHWGDKERKYVLPARTQYDPNFLPVLQNLTALGLTESDIGAIVGYQGAHSEDWLGNLKQRYPEVKEACDIGARTANANLVAHMYKTATGYDYVEEEYRRDPETGEMVLYKMVPKHQPGNATMAMFIATNRMPEQFKHRIETTRKSFIIDAKGELSSEQIEKLAGTLMEESRRVKQIESEVIDVESSGSTEYRSVPATGEDGEGGRGQ